MGKDNSRKQSKSLGLELLFCKFLHLHQWLNTIELHPLLMQCLLCACVSFHGICPTRQLGWPAYLVRSDLMASPFHKGSQDPGSEGQ